MRTSGWIRCGNQEPDVEGLELLILNVARRAPAGCSKQGSGRERTRTRETLPELELHNGTISSVSVGTQRQTPPNRRFENIEIEIWFTPVHCDSNYGAFSG